MNSRCWRALEAQARVGRYRLQRPLPATRVARRYLAVDDAGGPLLVQVCHPELSCESTFRERFCREAEHYSALWGVLAWGECQGLLFVAGPLPPGPAVSAGTPLGALARDVVEALEEAHLHGILHRNLHPENILLTRLGAVVVDFGLFSEAPSCRFMRTPFTAPEQREPGGRVGPWTDQFALGKVLLTLSVGVISQAVARMTHPLAEERFPDLRSALRALDQELGY